MNLSLSKLAAVAVAMAFPLAALAADPQPPAKPATPEKAPAAAAEAAKQATPEKAPAASPVVVVKTSMGEIKLKLNREKAPITVDNFLKYVDSKHFDGTIFHRTINNFMIQGGGFDKERKQKPVMAPIKNEAGNGLKNLNYTVAMARTGVVDSATAQFFINVKDNAFLDHRDETPAGFGYCVFGEVIAGKEVVDKIKAVAVKPAGAGNLSEAEPVELVVIESVTRE